jgi:hypothetical protein
LRFFVITATGISSRHLTPSKQLRMSKPLAVATHVL